MEPEKHTTHPTTDHDMLVTLNVRVQDLISLINRLDGQTSKDIGGLQTGKVDKTEMSTHTAIDSQDHTRFSKSIDLLDERVDDIRKNMWIGIGAITVIQFIAPYIVGKYF